MSIPTVEEFYQPLLKVLSSSREPVAARDAIEMVADAAKLSDEDRRQQAPGGNKPIYSKRISWAMTHLKRAGHTRSPGFGLWEITDQGEKSLAKGNGALAAEVEKAEAAQAERSGRKNTARLVRNDPDEIVRNAVSDAKAVLAEQLQERVSGMDPAEFERLVLEVMRKAYGRPVEDRQHSGRQGDGGIDGRIALDPLKLQWAYMQAKRWKGNVGAPEVQQFAGALGSNKVSHGILVTCGGFTREARDAARQSDKNIRLMDGEELVQAMIELEVGVTHENIRLPRMDRDFFEGEA
jgi:restriction system protein